MRRGTLVVCLVCGFAAMANAQSGWVSFVEETSNRLVADPALGTNDNQEKDYAWGDVDKDGDIDIVCVRKNPFTTGPGRPNVLFLNEGVAEGHPQNGVFVDRTADFMLEATDGGQGFNDGTNDRDVILVDVDGDTWLDIVTAVTVSDGMPKTMSHPRIYLNKRDSGGLWQGYRYEEARIPQMLIVGTGLAASPRFCSVSGGDVSGDPFPELYFGDYDSSGAGGSQQPSGHDFNDRLLLNDGTGFFTDTVQSRMNSTMLFSQFGMAVAIADMNGDGVNDIVKDTALADPRRVSISYNDPANEGFFDEFDIVYTNAPYHITVGDLSNDDRLDIVITDDGQDAYLINTGNGSDGLANFTSRVLLRSSGTDAEFGGNIVIADMNNDGFQDVIVADVDVDSPGCSRRMHMFRNLGDVPIVTLQEQGGAESWTPNGVHDVAVFDINEDGWLDMFVGTCTGTRVFINVPPQSLIFTYPDGLPGLVDPNTATDFRVTVSPANDTPKPATGRQHLSVDGGPFVATTMFMEQPNRYNVTLPGVSCTSEVRFYISSLNTQAELIVDPEGAPGNYYTAVASFGTETTLAETFEQPNAGWTVANDPALETGGWERVDPVGTFFPTGSNTQAQPENDFGAAVEETMCYITGQHTGGGAGMSDVDGGPTTLTSPIINLENTDAVISYARWQFSDSGTADALITEVTSNGVDWVQVDSTMTTAGEWEPVSFRVGDHVTPTAIVQVRFVSADVPNNSVTESGIDSFSVNRLICSQSCTGDPQCDDFAWCSGVETCVDDVCVPGADPCPGQLCDEFTDSCVDCLDNLDCSDGVFCNGEEICSNGVCTAGTAPCPAVLCDEPGDVCNECSSNLQCDDLLFCNGLETCDDGTCTEGADPCPVGGCDEVNDTCTECDQQADCDDGFFCNGVETCIDGSCVDGAAPCGDLSCDDVSDSCVRLLQEPAGTPLRGLTPAERNRFDIGRAEFDRAIPVEDGLGPIFNQTRCGSCHNAGGLGGSGSQLVTRFGLADKGGGFSPLDEFGGSLLQANALDDDCREDVAPEANVITTRLTNSTFGGGLVEAIPGEQLLANATNPPGGISGEAHMMLALEDSPGDPLRVGRFGWKAQLPTILSFSGDAARNEMGFTNRLVPTENDPNGIRPPHLIDCDSVADPEDGPEDGPGGVLPHFIDRVTDFQRFSAPPPQTPRSGMSGEQVFNSIGCNDCHVRSFTTGLAAETALSHRTIKPYSDFLLHEMGQFADGIEDGTASMTEIRTPSLWGLRVRQVLWHDGSVLEGSFTDRVTLAINQHDGSPSEGSASAQAFAALSQPDKNAVIAFLESLGRREFDQNGDNMLTLADLQDIAANCFSGPVAAYTPDDPCSVSDFDQDGDVDLGDYAAMQQAFGPPPMPPAP